MGRSGTPLSLSASACWGVAGTLTWAGLRTPPSTSHTVGLGSYNQRLWGSGPATSTWLELGERPVWFAPAGVWGSWDMGHSVLTPGKSQQSRTSWYLRRRPHPPASVGPQPTMGGKTAALCLRPALRAIPSELRSREQHLTCVGLPSPSQFSPECLMNLEVNLAFPPPVHPILGTGALGCSLLGRGGATHSGQPCRGHWALPPAAPVNTGGSVASTWQGLVLANTPVFQGGES